MIIYSLFSLVLLYSYLGVFEKRPAGATCPRRRMFVVGFEKYFQVLCKLLDKNQCQRRKITQTVCK